MARHKARLLARGFTQVESINFNEIYTFVARMALIRVLCTIIAIEDFKVHQMMLNFLF